MFLIHFGINCFCSRDLIILPIKNYGSLVAYFANVSESFHSANFMHPTLVAVLPA